MTKPHFTHAIVVACMLLAFAGSAAAGILKCTDKAGAVTFTDVPCNADADAAHVSIAIDAAPVKTRVLPLAGNVSAAEEARVTARANKPAANRGMALDVATLKAARASMVSMDQASALVRQQALGRPKNYL